jgi:hypothetical protein
MVRYVYYHPVKIGYRINQVNSYEYFQRFLVTWKAFTEWFAWVYSNMVLGPKYKKYSKFILTYAPLKNINIKIKWQ